MIGRLHPGHFFRQFRVSHSVCLFNRLGGEFSAAVRGDSFRDSIVAVVEISHIRTSRLVALRRRWPCQTDSPAAYLVSQRALFGKRTSL
jgi:hypothetical protein